ncbi:MAG: YfiR family protein [Acidobacteriota bacterium]
MVRTCIAFSVFAAAGDAWTQSVTAAQLKAGFVFNFARFAEWPIKALGSNASLVLCVRGDAAVEQSLDQWADGHEISGHHVTVRAVRAGEPVNTCHLLYAGSLDKQQAVVLLESVKGLPIFTVSDLADFAAMGGTAHLFPENGRLRFAVNVESAQRAGLHLSSQLLALARIVKDEPYAMGR